MSPISSRNSVPSLASSKRPGRARTAPVKAPRSCPNSSDSSRPSGIAAQLTGTNGPSFRELRRWIPRASTSLPVPLSPRISTVRSVGAARWAISTTRLSASLCPISPSTPPGWPSRRTLICFWSRRRSSARETTTWNSSILSGLVKKS